MLAPLPLWIFRKLTRTSYCTHSVWRGVVSVLCRDKKFWTHPWAPMQLGIAKDWSGTNPLLPCETRRPQCTRFCAFSHISQMETLWTEKWKGTLRKPTAVHRAAGRQSRTCGTVSRLYCKLNHQGVGHPLTLPATRWDLSLSLLQKNKTLVEIERCRCKDALWASR